MRGLAGRAVVIAVMVLGTLLTADPAAAERRLALVVGNSAYAVQPLDNPANDAALMAETLSQVGFEVTHVQDLGERDFLRTVISFGRDLRAAGEDAVGLFYYAGHAIQADGENYLIPVDAELQDALDLQIQAVEAADVMRALEAAGNRLNMVILDACRNNPFKAVSRSGTRGLAKLDAPRGTLIAYSTAPGDVAADGAGRNSPYTRALAKAILTPGLPVEQAFKRVRIDVVERTGGRQTPWESSSLTGDFYFTAAAPEPAPAPQVAAAPPPADNRAALEIEFWKGAAEANTEAAYRGYLEQFPNGSFASLAQARIEGLAAQARDVEAKAARETELAVFQTIQANETVEGYESYLAQYPDGLFAALARQRIQALETMQSAARSAPAAPAASADDETVLWNAVKDGTTKAEFQSYLDAYPQGQFAAIAQARIAAIEERRQTAALFPASGHPDDGRYRFFAKVVAKFGPRGGFCGPGESAEVDFEIRDGEYNVSFTSNRGSQGRVYGVVSEGRLHMTPRTRQRKKFYLDPDDDGWSGQIDNGIGYCVADVKVVRLSP